MWQHLSNNFEALYCNCSTSCTYGCVIKLVYMHVRMSMCLDLDEPLQNI
jgi:hypothetical protein